MINCVFIIPLLDEALLNKQTFFSKITMMLNVITTMKPPTNYNMCSWMWALLANNQIIFHKLLEWLKIVGFVYMAMVLGSVKINDGFPLCHS
jgi:hypothetical protein